MLYLIIRMGFSGSIMLYLIIRIGFGGILYDTHNQEPPKNSNGDYLGPYIAC